MVRKLWDKLVTSLGLTHSKHDIIKLWVMSDQGTSYMLKFMLYSEPDMTILKELLSTWRVTTDEENWHKLSRAGLVHQHCGTQECCGSCTPTQMELPLTTSEAYEQVHGAWNDET